RSFLGSAGGGQEQVGGEGGQESRQQPPREGGRGADPAAKTEQLVQHVEQRAGGDRQERDREVARVGQVADPRAQECRASADQSRQAQKTPRGLVCVGRRRGGGGEALGDVVQREADRQHARER